MTKGLDYTSDLSLLSWAKDQPEGVTTIENIQYLGQLDFTVNGGDQWRW